MPSMRPLVADAIGVTVHYAAATEAIGKLTATLEGTETDPQGNERVGLSAKAQINRSDHDMKFNMALGSGNVVVGDKVKILLDISAVKAS